MGVLAFAVNTIKKGFSTTKKIGKGIGKSIKYAQGQGSILEDIKDKYKGYLTSMLKYFLLKIVIYGLLISLVIGSIGAMFEWFSKFRDKDLYDITSEDLKEWSDALSEEDIKAMEEYGLILSPKMMSKYYEIEEKSIPDNIKINIPRVTKTWNNGSFSSSSTSYEKYNLNRKDSAYSYRFWWQSIASLDLINNTGYSNNKNFIEDIQTDLKPVFKWADSNMDNYKVNDNYIQGRGIENTVKITEERTTKVYDEHGDMVDNNTLTTEDTTYYPVPYLTEINTMFADIKFNYEKDYDKTSSTNTYSRSYEVSRRVLVSTNPRQYETYYVTYTEEVTVVTTKEKETWKLVSENKSFNDRFADFIKKNKMSRDVDIPFIHMIAQEMPQSDDFVMALEEYIYYLGDIDNFGEFKGGIGDFKGDYEIIPSDFIRSIPLFLQTDSRWSKVPYSYTNNSSHGTIGTSGCGPTSAAMVITGLGGYNDDIDLNGDGVIDPYEATMYSLKKGHRIYGSGTSHAFFGDIGKATGLKVSVKDKNQWKDVVEALQKGNVVIASMTPGVFTKGGHFIVLVGIDKNGKVIVNDPNSTKKSNMTWGLYNPVLSQSKKYFIFSK